VVEIRRTPPPEKISAATNRQIDRAILSPVPPTGYPLTPSYIQTRSVVPPPSRRRSGRRRGGEPATRRRQAGANEKGKKRLSYCSGERALFKVSIFHKVAF
jgi:hypothetical protein